MRGSPAGENKSVVADVLVRTGMARFEAARQHVAVGGVDTDRMAKTRLRNVIDDLFRSGHHPRLAVTDCAAGRFIA
ncbi:hypothetical protein [Rhodococcoides yunnanense]|uniref:hypothetical protein n=1 Tax=Rhodococcoides yunnanense TaxID=278209 RepID=UPI000933DC5B|nr:hypothetical protein [Rhodococcus yunnanensis]